MSQTADHYLGNPNLKKANVPVEFTKEQLSEYLKCQSDIQYFVETYVQIVNVDKGLIPFQPWSFQKKMLDQFVHNRFNICKLPRQSGKSTTTTSYILWKVLFHPDQNIAILANKGALARDLLGKIQLAYEYLPKWLQQGVLVWNKGNIELENGCRVVAASTSSSAIRGGSYNLIFLDEFAFVGNHLADEFFASVYPTISSGTTSQVIIVSTPNGMNHFYKMWSDAENDNSDYIPIDIHWSEIPGRDEKWKEETIRNTSEEQFRQEFECEFIGSASTLITSTKLRQLAFRKPSRSFDHLDIYEEPQKGKTYIMTVDCSRGIGIDYNTFVVVDTTAIPYRMVAKYTNNTIAPMLFPTVIMNVCKEYNDAYVLVETNDIGGQVADILHNDLEYEHVLTSASRGRAGMVLGTGFGGQVTLGVRTTKSVKALGCRNLKDLIENDKLLIEDFDTISELASFISKGTSFAAEEGAHDDLVMCLVLFGWLVKQQYFKDISDTDIRARLQAEKLEMEESSLLPFGFHEDGNEPVPEETYQPGWMDSEPDEPGGWY